MAKVLNDYQQEAILEKLLKWMDKHFDGDLSKTASLAAQKAKADGLIFGALWDEIGTKTMMNLYRLQLNARRRNTLSVQKSEEGLDEWERASLIRNKPKQAEWKFVPGVNRYCNILDLTKQDAILIAEHYDGLAKANAHECRFWRKVAEKLEDGQQVKDVFDLDKLRQLRKQV